MKEKVGDRTATITRDFSRLGEEDHTKLCDIFLQCQKMSFSNLLLSFQILSLKTLKRLCHYHVSSGEHSTCVRHTGEQNYDFFLILQHAILR